MSLALRNGRTDTGAPISLTLRGETIANLDPSLDLPGLDLGFRLLLPGLIDAHVHLDKTLLGHAWVPHQGGADVRARVATEKRLRAGLDWDIGHQGDILLQRMLHAGTTVLRTHVDIDDQSKLKNLHAVLELRQRWNGRLKIQIVAFPQSGILHCPGMPGLLEAALSEGADLIGGLDPAGFDGDMDAHLATVFGLAETFGKPVDIHLHDGGATGLRELHDIAARTRALGMQGKVMVSHAFALGDAESNDFAEIAQDLAESGVSIMTSIPGDRRFPPIAALAEAGVNLCLGSDNIRDAWSPMTVISMFERAMLAAYRSGFRDDAQLRKCLNLSIEGGARALGLPPGTLTPGAPADLIAVSAPNLAAAVVERPRPRLVVHNGHIVVNRMPQ
jgi:cytosine deaminase